MVDVVVFPVFGLSFQAGVVPQQQRSVFPPFTLDIPEINTKLERAFRDPARRRVLRMLLND